MLTHGLSRTLAYTARSVSVNSLVECNRTNPACDLDAESFCYFGSGTKLGMLSNFALCDEPFFCRNHLWTTSEHAFQAILRVREEDWGRLAFGGDLSSLTTGLPLVFKADEVAKKKKHYGPTLTGRPAMTGIVAKMAVKPNIAADKRVALRLKTASEAQHSVDEMGELFEEILLCKYRANPRFLQALKSTQDKMLIEFSRGAERETLKNKPPLWTGLVGKDKRLYGLNLQGILQMKVRALLLVHECEA